MEPDPYERLEHLLPESDELGIDGYETIEPIGEGGFGRVFKARQLAFGRDVAVKVLAASGMKDETIRRFERECRAIGTLSGHPHIVTIYDSGISRWGRPYIVMDHMSGGSYADVVNGSDPISADTVVDAIIKICGAVETAHRAGILHRDIKPENILLSAYGEPKLADFGVASIPGGYQTHTGAITASLAHAAPEVLEGEKATRAVDVYALGSTLFALIDGRPAFSPTEEGGLQSLIARTLTQPVPDLRVKGVAPEVCDIIETAMAKAPEDRYDSAEALGGALQAAQLAMGSTITEMPLERAALVVYPAEPAVGAESRTQLRERRELTPPQAVSAPKRVMWRSPLFAAAVVLALAVSSGSVIALRARGTQRPAPATAPQGETTDLVTEAEDEDEVEAPDRRRDKPRQRKTSKKKKGATNGGNLAFASGSGGSYASSISGGGSTGGAGDSYTPPSSGGSAGSTNAGTGSGGTGGGGSGSGSGGGGGQPQPEPEPLGSERIADITFYYHWSEDGSYFFTANYEESQSALRRYDRRAAVGRVWSTSKPGDGLTPLCPRPSDPCYGHVAKEAPKSGTYVGLYYHPGGEHGRFFSTNRSATYNGQPLSLYGYIRP
jgi:tRNA A-37 threonylcarbamoyl transferase component Bud32